VEKSLQEIDARSRTGRVLPSDIELEIKATQYFTLGEAVRAMRGGKSAEGDEHLDRVTLCVITMNNGFVVTGESAVVLKCNFDAEIGRKVARQDAIDKLWPIFGYQLRSKVEGA
jgi:hypothetical protein